MYTYLIYFLVDWDTFKQELIGYRKSLKGGGLHLKYNPCLKQTKTKEDIYKRNFF